MEPKSKPGRVHVADDDDIKPTSSSFVASRMNSMHGGGRSERLSLERTLSAGRNDFAQHNIQNHRLSPTNSYNKNVNFNGSPKDTGRLMNSAHNSPRVEEVLNEHDAKILKEVLGEDDNEFAADVFSKEELDMKIYWRTMNIQQIIKRIFATIFLTLEIETSSNLARVIAVFTKLVILVAVSSYMASTDPSLRVIPNTCDSPICSDDSLLCPGYQTCQDINAPAFDVIENVCVYIFTAEYVLRLCSVWAVTPRVAGILPEEWIQKAKDNIDYEQPSYSAWYSTFRFFIKIKNLIDLASICPTYFALFLQGSAKTQFLRILRLLRIIRVLRLLRLLTVLEKVDVAADLIAETMRQSLLLLTVFMFFVVMYIALFGCLIFLLEQGTFTVNEQYPNGAYLRSTSDYTGLEVSPFDSVATGMYWAVGTASGAGDISPTSHGGRFLANMVEIIGIFGLAFPVGVIGSELDHAKQKWYKKFLKKHELRRKSLLIEVEKQVDMISGNGNGVVQREVDLLSPLSRRESIDHEHEDHDGHDGSGTQTMLKAILAKLQEDKSTNNGLVSPTLGASSTTKDDRRSLKSGIRRVSQQNDQQQLLQLQQQSNGDMKSDVVVPFPSTTGKVWNVTEEKDHSMNHQIVTIVPTSLSAKATTSITTMVDDDDDDAGGDVHFVYGEKKSAVIDDNDDDISVLIRLARADVIRNHEYIQLATEDMNRAMTRLEATKHDAQLAIERLEQLKKLSVQFSKISNKQEINSVVQIRPSPTKTSSKSTLATERKNSKLRLSQRESDYDHTTDGGSDTYPNSQPQLQQQSPQQPSQQQSQPIPQSSQPQMKRTLLGRKRTSSKPDMDLNGGGRPLAGGTVGVGGGAVVLPPLQSSVPLETHHLST